MKQTEEILRQLDEAVDEVRDLILDLHVTMDEARKEVGTDA